MFVDIYDTDQKYDLIVADPPWKQSKGGKKSVRKNSSGEPLDYPVCTLEEIKEHLAKANGYAENLTLDRIENNKGYCPSNCRWVDRKVQANNTRNCVFYTYNGEVHTLAEWADIVKIPKTTLWNRIKMYGWELEKALTTPVATRSNNAKTYNFG